MLKNFAFYGMGYFIEVSCLLSEKMFYCNLEIHEFI